MSITGKMIIDGESFNLLSYRIRFFQQKDIAGCPRGRVNGGLIELKIEAHRDHIFHHWALQSEQMKDLELQFSPVTKISKSRTIQLYDVYCARIAISFDNYTNSPMTYTLLLSPGIFVDGGVVFKKPWHVTDLETMGAETTPDPGMLPKPSFLGYFFEDENGEKIEQGSVQPEQKITLVIETENADGETIKIDLNDDQLDFKYNNKVIENDVLKGIRITGEQTRVELTAIKEE